MPWGKIELWAPVGLIFFFFTKISVKNLLTIQPPSFRQEKRGVNKNVAMLISDTLSYYFHVLTALSFQAAASDLQIFFAPGFCLSGSIRVTVLPSDFEWKM